MSGPLRVLAAGLLVLAHAGCGVELLRPVAEPPAVQARPVEAPLDAAVVCQALHDHPGMFPETCVLLDVECSTQAIPALVNALRAGGVFRGDVLAKEPTDGSAALVDARLTWTRVSRPEPEERIYFLIPAVFTAGLLAPLCLIWTDREPDLADTYVLEVVVRGEEAVRARYEVVARGTISAQQTTYATEGIKAARVTLAELAMQSLVSRFADDREAQARLSALLSDEPATELEPLLVTKETYAPRARWRTRRLIAWTNASLAVHVSEAKTSELRALLGRLQTCMVDLAHESEVSKDAAQTLTAKGGAEAEAVNARELSLAYRERGEALRPILTACKDELEGRGR